MQFKEFVDLCHSKNIKVILDAVFNHCSSDFHAFNDVRENGENSRYCNWFHINSFPLSPLPDLNYECFEFISDMPKFNVCNDETSRYLRDVAAFWIENYGIDGWRFDVADEVDRKFWIKLRNDLKEKASNTVTIGEAWEEASSWLNNDIFDSATNYPVTWFIYDLFIYGCLNVEQFKHKVEEHLMKFNLICTKNLMNVVDTHDTQRFLTTCGNDSRKFALGIVFQFTFPGIPMIYYGDEIGMSGGGDPDCRKPMVWDSKKWNKEILDTYKFLIALRKNTPVLIDGEYRNLKTSGDKEILAYKRDNLKECIIVVMNAADKHSQATVNINRIAKSVKGLNSDEVFDTDNGEFRVNLAPFEWRIYEANP